MTRSRVTRSVQAVVLSSLAALMVAGLVVMGGFGSADSAEAHNNCRRLSLLRCQPRQERQITTSTRTIITTINP